VKWKGYPTSENSWVKESDAPYVSATLIWLGSDHFDLHRNADELISLFMDKRAKEKNAEKKKAATKPRKSSDRQQDYKKRGRATTKSRADSSSEESERSTVKTKKQKKVTASAKNKESHEKEDTDMGHFASMEKYMHLDSWDDLISKVETIEKDDDGVLYLYGIL
jgi:hypothetical protein